MKIETSSCPFCDHSRLTEHYYSDKFDHNGKPIVVDNLESFLCLNCNEKAIFPHQARANQSKIADAKRREDKLLLGIEIKALRERLKLTQEHAAQLFGGGRNGFSKYERGEVIQSVAMDRLMRLSLASKESFFSLCSIAGFPTRDEWGYLDTDHNVVCCNFGSPLFFNKSKPIYESTNTQYGSLG